MTAGHAPTAALAQEVPAQPPWASASRVLSVLERIAREANSGQEPRDVLQRVVSSVVQHGPWNICWAGLVDEEADRIYVHADAGMADHAPPLPFEQWTASKTVSWQAILQRKPYVVPDALTQEEYPLLKSDAGLRLFRSVLIIPLFLGQEVGVIWFCTRSPRDFSEDETAFAEVVGSLTSVALSNAAYQRQQHSLLEQERRQTKELRRLNDLADQQYQDLQRLSQSRTALLQELLMEGGIDGLAALVFETLGADVFVIDRFGNPLAEYGNDRSLSLKEREIIAQVMKSRKGLINEAVELDRRRITAIPIDSGDTRLGYLCCGKDISTLDTIAKDLLSQASLHMTLELVKDRVRLESHTRLFGDFVAALGSEHGDAGDLERAATAVGLSLQRPIRVFRGRLDHKGKIDDLLLFSRHLHRLLGQPFQENVIVPAGDRDLLILVQWPDSDLEATSFTSELRRGLDRVRRMMGSTSRPAPIELTTGMGALAVGPAELRQSEKEARQSLEVAEVMGISDTDVDLQSLGAYSLLTTMADSQTQTFADRYVGPIRNYDRKHGSELEVTIAAYIDNGGSINATATKLHIHASTLKYRLKRVQELTGMSLSNPENYLCFSLACRITRLRNTTGSSTLEAPSI